MIAIAFSAARFRGCAARFGRCGDGKISYRPGFTLANVDSVDVLVKGRAATGPARKARSIRS